MNRKKQIQKQLRALAEEGQTLYKAADAEKRKLGDEEQARIGEIEEEMTSLEAELTAIERRSGFESRIDRLSEPEEPADPGSQPVVEDRTDYSRWPVEEASQFFAAVRDMATTGRLPSGMQPELRDAFSGVLEHRAPTGQGTLIDDQGGFLVPSTISSVILQKVYTDGQLISRTQGVPITVGNTTTFNAVRENSRVAGSRFGGITVARTAEAGAATSSTAKWDRINLTLKKLTALAYLTEEQLEDGPQALTVINDLVPRAITFAIEDELLNGGGGDAMEGVLNANCLVTVAKESGQAAATIVFENIVNMYSRMAASSRSNAVWFINQDIEPQLFTMSLAVGTGGIPVYMPAGGASSSPFGTLLGRPVVPIEHAATLGTVGDIVLADMSQYLYASKGGVKTAQSIHVKFAEGETAFRFMLRNDGKSWWSSPVTPAKGSNTQSPFVALATRA